MHLTRCPRNPKLKYTRLLSSIKPDPLYRKFHPTMYGIPFPKS